MRDSNFGMGVLHVKVKYWRIFCDVISLLARVFIVSFDRAYKEVSTKKIENFLWLSFCDMTVPYKNQCTVRVTLTYDLWRSIIFCELIINL